MNRHYRSIWNDITQTFVAAAEIVRQNGKQSNSESSVSAPVEMRGHYAGMMALEQRFMFDGAAVIQAAHAMPDQSALAALPDTIAPVLVRAADPTLNQGKKEVVFVDTSVTNYKILEAAIKDGLEVEEISSNASGLAQIAKWALTHQDYDAIHIISHGSEAVLNLGTDAINESALNDSATKTELALLGHALKAGGDLLIYGCNIGEAAPGKQFVADLSILTGLDVAASNNPTGNINSGGDWSLEVHQGNIDTAIALDSVALKDFNSLLTAYSGTINFDNFQTYANANNDTYIYPFSSNNEYRLILHSSSSNVDTYAQVGAYGVNTSPKVYLGSSTNSVALLGFGNYDAKFFTLSFNQFTGSSLVTFRPQSVELFDVNNMLGNSQGDQPIQPMHLTFTGYDANGQIVGTAKTIDTSNLPIAGSSGYMVDLSSLGTVSKIILTNPDTVNTNQLVGNGTSFVLVIDNFSVTNVQAAGVVTGPTVTDANIQITSTPTGLGGTYKIGDTVTAKWNNTSGGDNQTGITTGGVTIDFSQFGGSSAVAASNDGNGNWTASYTIASGSIDLSSRNVSVTATNGSGTTTTADSSNLSVDNIAPTITDARVSISGGSGTGGAYKIGDTVTATWSNTAGGDNNIDTISSVTADFSQFGGGSVVSATNSSGTWSASYTITSGAIDTTSRNVSFSATDNAGNTTTRADTTNAIVDSIAPTVTDGRISISGASGTSGAFKTGDTVTATWNNTAGGDNNSDTISGATVNFSQFGGGSAVAATNSSGTWTATYTIVGGSVDTTNRNVSVTATDNAGNTTTTADTTNATVDNIAPTVTDAKISISGGTGAGGAFKIGDTVTATWNNTAGGDNNTDTISAVTMDFSQFGGGSAVSATNSSGTWTAAYSIAAGSLNRSTNRQISVTATDNAGNVTTTADSANATVDNVVPVITSVSIPNTTMKVGDVVTATITVSTDSDTYTLSSGSVGGFALGSLTKISGTSYSATFTVTEAGTDVAAGSSIPVSLVLSDAAGNLSTTYSTALAQAADAINAHSPSAIALSGNTLSNSASANTVVGTLSSTDATVGDTFTYSLVAGAGSTDNASFAISGSSLQANNPSALSAGGYSVRVRTTDVAGNSFEQTFSITVTSNQAPAVTTPTAIALTDTSSTDTFSNQTGTLSATDADGIASYGIQGGTTGGSDVIGAATYDVSKLGTYGTLYVKSSDGSYVYVPNASAINGRLTNTSETFTVTATDLNANAATGTATLTVNITGVNDLPTDISLTATSVSQSGGANATVGTLSTTDADTGDTHTYSLVSGTGDTNNGLFNISGTSLRATNADSMSPGTYTVRVQTTDAASATYAKVMTITVADDVAPTVTSVSVPSNAWYVVGQNLDFTVNFSESVTVVTTGGTPRIALTVGTTTVYADYVSGSGTTALVFRYTVQTNDLDTNGIAVGTLALNGGSLADASGNNAVLTLNSVGSTSAVLVDAVTPSAPSTPDLALASDTGTLTTDNITSDTTPTFTGTAEANSTVTLYDSNGTTVLGTATADGSGSWSITSSTLTGGTHNVTVTTTDAAGNTSAASAALTITVDATAPSAVTLSTTTVADTNATSGSTIASLSATDTTALTYALVAGAGDTQNGSFTISGGNLAANGNLIAGTYNIRVQATDAAGNTTEQTFTITVTAGPSVTSINRAGATALTNANSVAFTVTFNESVTGVDTSDFVLTRTGSVQGIIASVTGSGSTYTVTVNGLSGDGTLRLDLNNTGTGIANTGLQAITGGFTSGQSYTLDTSSPTAPTGLDLVAGSDSGTSSTDNVTTDTTPTITGGGAEAGATVTLYDTDGTTVLGTATADGSGNWSITSSALTDGVHNLTTKVTDAAGNTSVVSAGLSVTIDTTAPSASGTPDLASASDSGSSSTDNITSVTTPTITGGGAEAGATVTLYDTDGTTVLGTATADGSGNWSITSSTLSSGTHTLTTKVTDAAGNTGPASAGLAVTIDTTAPTASGTPDLASASDSGASSTDNITSVTTPTITGGGAEAGATVTLYDTDGTTVLGTATADGSGNWSITSSTLSSGTHTLTTKVTDAAGNTGPASAGLTVTIDTTAPSASGTPDLASASDSGSSNTDNITNVTTPVITGGGAEAGVTVTLYDTDGTTVLGTATADGSGNWSITSSTLSSGTHTLTTKVTDAAGNTGATSAGLAVTVDTTAPTSIALNRTSVTEADTGTNSTIASLSSTDSNAVTYTLVPGNGLNDANNSSFSITGTSLKTNTNLAAGTYNIYVAATDAAGNVTYQSLTITVTNQQVTQTPLLPQQPPVVVLTPQIKAVAAPEVMANTPASSFFNQSNIGDKSAITIDSLINSLSPVINDKVVETASRAVSIGVRSGSGEVFVSGLSAINKLAEMEIPQGEASTISLPAGTFVHTDATARVSLSARLSDGKPLPAYVKFNTTTGTFTVDASNRAPVDLQIRVIAVDDKGKTANTTVVIKIKGKSKSSSSIDVLPISGKITFTEQLKNSEKPSGLMSHLAALNKAFETSNANRSHS